MPSIFFLFVIVSVSLAAANAYKRRQKARAAAATALATQHGFQIDVGPKPPPGQKFDIFTVGRSRRVSYQLWRAGEQDSVFEYQYTTGSGKNSHTYHHTCALIALPFTAPHTKIGPEGFWSGLGRAVGLRDIEVESTTFNDEYRVTSDDERFAVTLLDQQMIGWFLSNESGRGAIKFELWGSWLLCISNRLDLERMFGYLDWSQSIRGHVPVVLSSLYPLS